MKNRERIEAEKLFKNYLIEYFFTYKQRSLQPIFIHSEERDSTREIGNRLTRALTDSHTCTML